MVVTGLYSIARITFANPLSVWARRMGRADPPSPQFSPRYTVVAMGIGKERSAMTVLLYFRVHVLYCTHVDPG